MSLRREGGLSRLLIDILLPLCVWVLMSSLLLYLLDIRSIFITGGEWRLRQAILAFAAAIILLQRLRSEEGKDYSWPYAIAIGSAITLFTAWHSDNYRTPVHPLIVFIVSEILFVILWFVGNRITAACAVENDEMTDQAVDSGILSRKKRKKQKKSAAEEKEEALKAAKIFEDQRAPQPPIEKTPEELEDLWTERMPRKHPGLVLLYFSLVAIPVFGLGIYVFQPEHVGERIRLGIYMFMYLWAAFALLCLSSLNQFRAYFRKRAFSLPDSLGIMWMASGFVILTIVILLAYFVPQPPSLSSSFVRQQVVSSYKGWESRYGIKDGALMNKKTKPSMKPTREKYKAYFDKKYENIDKMEDPYLSKMVRQTGFEPEQQMVMAGVVAAVETSESLMKIVIRVIYIIAILCIPVVLYMIIYVGWQALSMNIGHMIWLRKKQSEMAPKPLKKKKKLKRDDLPPSQFWRYSNPFSASINEPDGNALVRYMWMATMAMCADCGAPCPPERTPKEFLDAKPEPLKGFEEPAEFIAQLYTFSEFSGQDVEPSALEELKEFWTKLQSHAARVLPV